MRRMRPRIRGSTTSAGPTSRSSDIVPAYAGSTVSLDVCRLMVPGSSPHTREHRFKTRDAGVDGIVPAYARGAPACIPLAHAGKRIVPAYAGSTDPNSEGTSRAYRQDRPAYAGEHSDNPLPPLFTVRMRPASQGAPATSSPSAVNSWGCRPRIRGGRHQDGLIAGKQQESSPHTRGALRTVLPTLFERWDRPRIRGSIIPDNAHTGWLWGSSPHAREHQRQERRHHQGQKGSSPHTQGALNAHSSRPPLPSDASPHTRESCLPSPSRRQWLGCVPHTRGARAQGHADDLLS